jgi:hypothetical protein
MHMPWMPVCCLRVPAGRPAVMRVCMGVCVCVSIYKRTLLSKHARARVRACVLVSLCVCVGGGCICVCACVF